MGWLSNLFSKLFGGNSSKKTTTTDTTTKKTTTKETENSYKGTVNATTLNARSEPSTTAEVLYQLKKYTVVTIREKTGDWYKIYTEKGDAYCMAKYITVSEIKKLIVNAKVLNVRNYYSTDASVIAKVYEGNIFVIVSEHKGWYGINYNSKTGYVSADYVTVLNEESTKSTDNTPVVNNTTTKTYFNQRTDLMKVALEPSKKLSNEGQDTKGKIAVKTWNNYGNLITTISKELGIEVEIALAVICVESGGSGFSRDGKMIIRFENHVFNTYYGAKSEANKKEYDKHFSFNTKKTREDHKYREKASDDWKTCHTGQASEWEAFNIARKIAEKEAMYSISMGAPQVMGFNFKSIGYTSVKDMFDSFSKDIRYHILALFDFCTAKSQRVQYLLTRDFLSFAKEYNGLTAPEQYEKKLEEYYNIFKKLL